MKSSFSNQDSTGIVTLEGVLSTTQIDAFRDAFKGWYDGNPALKNVVVDFRQVEMIDSAGLGLLIALLKHVGGRGGEMKLVGLAKRVRLVFEITRTHRIFEICDTIEEALKI